MATPVPVVSMMYFLLSTPPKISAIVSPALSAMSTKLAIGCAGWVACFVACCEGVCANKGFATIRTRRATTPPARNCQKEYGPGTESILPLDTRVRLRRSQGMAERLHPGLRRHPAQRQIVLRRHAKRIGDTVEEGEQRRDVNRLGDLLLSPAVVAQPLDVFRGRAVRRFGYKLHVLHEGVLRLRQARLVEFALQYRIHALIVGPLNTQEVGMAVQSIRAPVKVGDVAGDHLLVAAVQMAFGKMNGVGELDDLAQKVSTRAETLDDPWHLLPT